MFSMGLTLLRLEDLRRAQAPEPIWNLAELVGRLTELGGEATLTLAFGLVLEAQERGEPVAWVTGRQSAFFAPDAAEGGVDLDALVVVRVRDAAAIPRAASELVRSGAFGLVVLDLPRGTQVPDALQGRLLGLAQKHDAAVVFLTQKSSEAPSLGSLISLRGETQQSRREVGVFVCTLRILKDKRRSPGWTHEEACRGPAGLR